MSQKIKNTLFQHKLSQLHSKLNKDRSKIEDVDFPQYRGLTFKEFWYKLNKDLKVDLEYYDYEEELTKAFEKSKYHWIKKSTGLGITEFMIRWIAWNCLKDDVWKNKQVDVSVVLVTGPRIDLAVTIMKRLKHLFLPHIFKTKETICKLNGCIIEAYPSHHVESARGLNPRVVFPDEADFFPPGQQLEMRDVAERYIAKSNPHIIMVSTPNLPGGMFEDMEFDESENFLYDRHIMLYDRGMGKIYTEEQIEIAKQSPSFEREYNGKYGYGVGDIFENIDDIITEYDLEYTGGRAGTYADPAFGFSKFGLVSGEVRDNIIYITEAEEFKRESPNSMLDVMETSYNRHKQNVKVDAAHPGFIKDLNLRGVPALAVAFGSLVPESEGLTKSEKGIKQENVMTLKKKMPINASVMVKNKEVRIHKKFTALISQMRAVKFDKKGGIDKEEVSFDLIDALDMLLWDLKQFDYSSIGISHDGKRIDQKPKPKKKEGLKIHTETVE